MWLFCALIGAVAGALVWDPAENMAVGLISVEMAYPEKFLFHIIRFLSVLPVRQLSVFSEKYSETIPKIWKLLWEKSEQKKDTNTKTCL